MDRPYSQDLRERVVKTAAVTLRRQAAARFRVGISKSIRWMAALTATGTVATRPQGHALRSKLDRYEAFLRALIEPKDDITLLKMYARLRNEHDLTVRLGILWSFLDAYNLTYKKMTARATDQECADLKAAQEAWITSQADLDSTTLVFLNDTWSSTIMARTRGRSPTGARRPSPVPHGHRDSMPLVTGLHLSGNPAPFVIDGPIDRDTFQAYVDRVLVIKLIPDVVVVMDYFDSHEGTAVRVEIEAAVARSLSLPPDSTDLNPIEMAFLKLKALLREAMELTVEGSWSAIELLADTITRRKCCPFIKYARYR